MDLDELMGYLITNDKVDSTLALKEEENNNEEESNN